MSVQEILEDMTLFEKPIQESDLKAPKPELVQDVFSFFLKEIYAHGLPPKVNPSPECLELIDFPSLHEDSPALFHFMRSVFEMLYLAQYFDFTLHDLMAPTASRFRWQLSALLNLAKYKQSRLPVYDALAAGEDEKAAERDMLAAQTEKVDIAIADIKKQRESEAPQVEELKRQIPELSAQLEEFKVRKLEMTEKTAKQKAEFASASEKLTNIKERNENLRKDIEEKRAKVVSSPNRALAEIAELEEKLRKARENTKSLKEKKAAIHPRSNAHMAATQALKASLHAQQECIARSERIKGGQAQLQKIVARKNEVQRSLRREEENGKILLKSIESMEGRRARQGQVLADVQNQMDEDAGVLRRKKMEVDRLSEEARRTEEECFIRVNELTAMTSALCKKFAEEMTEMMSKHAALLGESEKNKDHIDTIMDMYATHNKQAVEDARRIQIP